MKWRVYSRWLGGWVELAQFAIRSDAEKFMRERRKSRLEYKLEAL